jgi:hypothetical protein
MLRKCQERQIWRGSTVLDQSSILRSAHCPYSDCNWSYSLRKGLVGLVEPHGGGGMDLAAALGSRPPSR